MVNIEHFIPFVHFIDISFGKDCINGSELSIDLTKHIFASGVRGMVKSTPLVNISSEYLHHSNDELFIDLHDDAANQIAKLILNNRMCNFIWIGPDASLVPLFNPLHFDSPEELELGKEPLFQAITEFYAHPSPQSSESSLDPA